jgi:hypothetical protein
MKKYLFFITLFTLVFATEGFSVARSWVGIGAGGTGTDFNTGTNWSPAGVPTGADALTIAITAGTINSITLSSNITVGSLTMTVSGNRNGYLRANGFVLTISGAAVFNAVNYVSILNYSYLEIDAGTAPGQFIFNGATQIHTTGAGDTYIGGATASEGTMTFNNNLTMGAWAYTNPGDEPIWVFDGTGAQSVVFASVRHIKPSSMRFGVVNSPTVTITATAPGVAPGNYFTVYDGQFTVGNNAIVDLGDFDMDPWTTNTGIQVNSTSTLRIGNDGNFPGFGVATVNPTNYSSYTVSSTSTVHYNGGAAQSVSNLASPGYGHIMYSGAGVKTSAGSFSIRGNWTNNGTFAHNNSTHTFDGTPNQMIMGSSATTFYNLTENKLTNPLLLGVNNNRVNNVLTLTNGAFYLNMYTLIINNALTTAVTRTNGYIVSETVTAANPSILQWNAGATIGAFVYPFGSSAGTYIPFTFNKTTATASNVSVSTRVTATSANTPWATGVTHMYSPNLGQDGSDEAVIDRWWHITCTAATTANLTFSYRGIENTMIAPYQTGNIGAQYWGSAAWLPNNSNIGSAPAVTAGVGTVTANGVAFTAGTFTPMVLSSLAAPLPVVLVNFSGTCQNGFGELIWNTASETNNSHFDILRSDNGEPFHVVGSVAGNGTTSMSHEYKFIDEEPLGSLTMYRLAQYDFNGQSELYAPIAINSCLQNTSSVHAYDASSELVVLINTEAEAIYTVSIMDMQSRIVSSQQLSAGEGTSKFAISKEGIAPGIYVIMTQMPNGEAKSEKILIR